MNNGSPILSLQHISKKFYQGNNPVDVLSDIELTLNAGQSIALVGPSGSGKTTLLQIAGLLDQPSHGEVLFRGEPTHNLREGKRTSIRRHDIGFVYQFHHLISELSALENVMLPLMIARKPKKECKEEAEKVLTELGLQDRLEHTPSQLSGGQQQRVAIARALVHKPALLLADEPTGNLDPHTAEDVFNALLNACRNHQLAALIVTHNIHLAHKLDQIVTIHDGEIAEYVPED